MYVPFFALQREPFSIAPDPRFLFMSEAHREALAHLLYGLNGGGGFVLLTGDIGAGKTTVCRCFLDQLPANIDVAYVFNPKLSAVELLQTACDEFGIALPAERTASIKDLVDALNRFLLAAHAAGRHAVLIIDEAQALSAEVLEQLRLLTNLETSERKLLQIVLIGQPELRTLLARPELEQLAQRVIARYHLPALSEAETAAYVRHRLAVAGLAGEMPFDAGALRQLHRLCRGVPRRINLLADRALLGGYASGRARIDRRIVDRAAAEVFAPAAPQAPRPRRWLAPAAVALVSLAAGAAYVAQQRPAARMSAVVSAVTSQVAAPAAMAASAATRAPVVVTAAAAPVAAAPDAAAVLAQAQRSESQAWRQLAALWRLQLGDGEPCDAAAQQRVQCFRGSVGLGQVRDLDRPGVLTLRDAQDRPAYALLTALDDDGATLQLGGAAQRLPLLTLAQVWRGEYATYWRTPPGWPADAPLSDWMGTQLPGAPGQALKSRVIAFQVAHGLRPDGLAGPMTLMQINRAGGVDEPRLGSH